MSARISRKEIHYVLFKNTNFWMFGLFFSFYFLSWEPTSRFSRFGYMTSTISAKVIRVLFCRYFLFSLLFQPLFGLLSDKLGLRKYLLWIITGMLVMFAPFFILSSGHCYNTTF
ncbi:Lactose permease [Klebsiella pneumoniae]|nr:Lactose permease [Klebsiella pneumoniae]